MLKIISVILTLVITTNSVFPITKTKARIGSAVAGTNVGLAAVAGTVALGYSVNSGFNLDGRLVGTGGVAIGLASGLTTYYLMMKMFENYMPEYILNEVESVLNSLDQDELAKREFKSNEELIQYLNTVFGAAFSRQESINHLKNLDSKLVATLEQLNKTYSDVEKTNLDKTYKDLEERADLLHQFINSKQVQILLAFITTDSLVNTEINSTEDLVVSTQKNVFSQSLINQAIEQLSYHLECLQTAKSILSDLFAKIPSKPRFNDVFQELKDQMSQVNTLTNLIKLKKSQINLLVLQGLVNKEFDQVKLEDLLAIANTHDVDVQEICVQLSKLSESKSLQPLCLSVCDKVSDVRNQIYLKIVDAIIKKTESDSLVSRGLGTDEDFVYYAATKFEKAWYLVLAKQELAYRLNDLNYAKKIVLIVHDIAQSKPNYKKQELQALSEVVDLLINRIEDRILVVVKSPAYDNQLELHCQFLNDQEKKALQANLAREQREHEKEMAKIRDELAEKENQFQVALRRVEGKLHSLKNKYDSELSRIGMQSTIPYNRNNFKARADKK